MAGRARRKEMIQILERRLRDWTETQPEDKEYSVLDYVCSWIESGFTLTMLADQISEEMKWDISRAMLTSYVTNEGDAAAKRRLEQARLAGAHGLNDQAIKIIDNASVDKDSLTKAKMRADTRQWTAERWNRKDLGKAPDVAITVNNNTMHLDALRRRAFAQISPGQDESLPDRAQPRARLYRGAEESAQQPDDIADVIAIEPGESEEQA